MQNSAENNRHLAGPRLYDIDKLGGALDAALTSRQRPRDAAIRALHDKIAACLADGYSIADVIAMLQTAGMDGSDRQLRYALAQAGIDGAAGKAARAASRRTGAGRSRSKRGAGKLTAEEPMPPTELAPHVHADAEAEHEPAEAKAEAVHDPANAGTEGGRRPAGQIAPAGQPAAQSAAASAAPQMPPKTEAPTERKAPPSQREGQTEEEETALPSAPSDMAGHRVRIDKRPI